MPAPAKQRNYAIDFWRIFCTLGVAMMHFNDLGMQLWMGNIYDASKWEYPPIRLGLLLEFFLITGGFFMVASFKSKQRKGLTENVSAGKQAWRYGFDRFKMFWPCLLIGNVYGTALKCIVNGLSLKEWFYAFSVNAWDFFGLSELAAMGPTLTGGATYLTTPISFTKVWAVNYPLWYISALLIVCVPMYYLLAKNEESFKTIWMPLLSVVYIACYGLTPDFLLNRGQLLSIGIPVNVMWVAGGMACGAMLYYLVEYLKTKEIGKNGQVFLTLLNVFCTVFIIWTSIDNTFVKMMLAEDLFLVNEMIYMPAFACVLVCNSLNKDYLTRAMGWPILGKLGNFSLYWFVMHYPTAHLIDLLIAEGPLSFLNQTYYGALAFFIMTTAALGLLLKLACEKFFVPMIENLDKSSAPAPVEVKA